jgi:hypothetical protein
VIKVTRHDFFCTRCRPGYGGKVLELTGWRVTDKGSVPRRAVLRRRARIRARELPLRCRNPGVFDASKARSAEIGPFDGADRALGSG